MKSERGSTTLKCGDATGDRHREHADIAIVDGGDANHATLCRALTGADLSHAYVRSGVGALEQLATNRFKVALPDASLSDTDGVATLRKRMSEMQPVVRQNVVIAEPVLLSAATPDRIRTC